MADVDMATKQAIYKVGVLGLEQGREESHRRIAELEDRYDSLVSKIKGEEERLRSRCDEEIEFGRPSVAAAHKGAADSLTAILSDVEGGSS